MGGVVTSATVGPPRNSEVVEPSLTPAYELFGVLSGDQPSLFDSVAQLERAPIG
jgi:hypothetical protein